MVQRYWRIQRGLTMGAQGIILDDVGRVLLIRHGYRPGWHFPGGGVERNEPVLEALRREITEETGVVATGTPDLLGIYTNFRSFPSDHIVVFIVRKWTQPTIPPPNREIAEQGFFDRHALPDGVIEPVRRRLAEVFDRVTRDEVW